MTFKSNVHVNCQLQVVWAIAVLNYNTSNCINGTLNIKKQGKLLKCKKTKCVQNSL